MTACQLLDCLLLRCHFCQFCRRWNEDPFQACWECEHELGYEMFTLGMHMLEMGDNPFI